MPLLSDIARRKKIRYFLDPIPKDARVLEIGCGAGRLTRRYASAVRFAVGLDSASETLVIAKHERPSDLARKMAFVQTGASTLPFGAGAFDVVLFGWSL